MFTEERVVGNLARFVVIVWLFVVLILTQSYTASLTSMLTVQQLKPTLTDVNELIKNGEYVGMQKGSFVLALLKKMGFDESKIMEYNSLTECDEAFSKGSGNGGIAAAFDETPYMRLFIGHYCSKYTMVGPVYKTDGFGFAFPRGSPLVPDVSRAILYVTESDRMSGIERAWFGTPISCPDSSSSVSPNSLGLESFWVVFLIAGVASISAFIIFAAMLLHEHLTDPTPVPPNPSTLRKIILFFERFDKENAKHHAVRRKNELHNRYCCIQGNDGMGHAGEANPNNNPPGGAERNGGIQGNDKMGHAGEAIPNNNPPPAESPSTSSNHSNSNSDSIREQGRTLTEYGETSSSRQTPQERAIELTNVPNYQDRPGTSEITHETVGCNRFGSVRF